MIHAVMVFNNSGKARLTKFYTKLTEAKQQKMLADTYSMVVKRPDTACNFLEAAGELDVEDGLIIYRHYATLYFVFVADSAESELGILDLIQVFVEALDRAFENVCELDLIFHVDKVMYILNEVIMGGLVLETKISEVVSIAQMQNKIEKQEAGFMEQVKNTR
eukprot:Clim_evm7s166 gene=Clim_evmTU7s166